MTPAEMRRERPTVSVIIPCYNRARFLREAIDSTLSQSHPTVNLVVVDDGSTDSTPEILESYGSRITVLTHPGRVNRGQSASINLGLECSRGEYVGILDSDDVWLPEKVERQVGFLEANPEVGLVYGNGYRIDEHGNRTSVFYSHEHVEENDPARVLLDCYFLVPNNSLVRREVFDRTGGFDESLRAAQDHDMAIRIAEVTKLAYLNEFLFLYRRHAQSISRRNALTRWRNGFYILRKASRRHPYSPSVLRKRRAVLHFRLGQCYWERRNVLLAGLHFAMAGALDPIRAARVGLAQEPVSSPH